MELNYRPANYTGWPVPALYHYFLCISLHATKLQKIFESCNIFRNYFIFKMQSFFDKISDWLPPIFTKPSNTFSVAFQKVSEGFVARIPTAQSLQEVLQHRPHGSGGDGEVESLYPHKKIPKSTAHLYNDLGIFL